MDSYITRLAKLDRVSALTPMPFDVENTKDRNGVLYGYEGCTPCVIHTVYETAREAASMSDLVVLRVEGDVLHYAGNPIRSGIWQWGAAATDSKHGSPVFLYEDSQQRAFTSEFRNLRPCNHAQLQAHYRPCIKDRTRKLQLGNVLVVGLSLKGDTYVPVIETFDDWDTVCAFDGHERVILIGFAGYALNDENKPELRWFGNKMALGHFHAEGREGAERMWSQAVQMGSMRVMRNHGKRVADITGLPVDMRVPDSLGGFGGLLADLIGRARENGGMAVATIDPAAGTVSIDSGPEAVDAVIAKVAGEKGEDGNGTVH